MKRVAIVAALATLSIGIAAPAGAYRPSTYQDVHMISSRCARNGDTIVRFVAHSYHFKNMFNYSYVHGATPVTNRFVQYQSHIRIRSRIHFGERIRINVWTGSNDRGELLMDATRKALLCV